MKSIKEIKDEIGGKFLDFSELDNYMIQAGYHSNLPDVDLTTLGKDSSIIYLGKRGRRHGELRFDSHSLEPISRYIQHDHQRCVGRITRVVEEGGENHGTQHDHIPACRIHNSSAPNLELGQ